MSDPKDPMDSNDALLKSLESIKSLLAQSETKLSAARESLTQANQGTAMKKQQPEFNIPTLDEIVEPGEQIEIGLPDEADIPVLESVEQEAPVFNLADDAEMQDEGTIMIESSSLPFDTEETTEEEQPIPVLEIAGTPAEQSVAAATENSQPGQVSLPDLTPLLNAIDDIEGSMRSQISQAAIAFEEQLNTHLEVQLRKIREQIHTLADEFGDN